MDISGSNFRASGVCAAVCGALCDFATVAELDNVELTTQFVSETRLQAVVPASLLTASRVVPLAVKNPVLVQCQGIQFHQSDPEPFAVR